LQKLLFEQQQQRKKKPHPNNKLNELTGKEWIQETVSVWFQRGLGKGHPHTAYERQHPAPFPYLMVERLLRFFTRRGDTVLDPFAGVASTLKACALTGRIGVGVELVEKWIQLSRERLDKETNDHSQQELIKGDSREELKKLSDESFDFVVTSPPYWQILNKRADYRVREERLKENLDTRYSNDPKDLGNIPDYDTFISELKNVWLECNRVLKTGKYIAIVIGDFRHKSRYVAYHSDIARAMEEVGLTLKGITIFVQNAKKIYPYGYPYDFVPNIHHQYIMICKKEGPNAHNPAQGH